VVKTSQTVLASATMRASDAMCKSGQLQTLVQKIPIAGHVWWIYEHNLFEIWSAAFTLLRLSCVALFKIKTM